MELDEDEVPNWSAEDIARRVRAGFAEGQPVVLVLEFRPQASAASIADDVAALLELPTVGGVAIGGTS